MDVCEIVILEIYPEEWSLPSFQPAARVELKWTVLAISRSHPMLP